MRERGSSMGSSSPGAQQLACKRRGLTNACTSRAPCRRPTFEPLDDVIDLAGDRQVTAVGEIDLGHARNLRMRDDADPRRPVHEADRARLVGLGEFGESIAELLADLANLDER